MLGDQITPEKLYKRTAEFAVGCANAVRLLPKTPSSIEYGRQLIRASASPGANYIEAQEASSKKDFTYRLKVCRKECREALHWIDLITATSGDVPEVFSKLRKEAGELIKIFGKAAKTSDKDKRYMVHGKFIHGRSDD